MITERPYLDDLMRNKIPTYVTYLLLISVLKIILLDLMTFWGVEMLVNNFAGHPQDFGGCYAHGHH